MGWLNNPKRAWEKKVLLVDKRRAARAREQEQQRLFNQRAEEARLRREAERRAAEERIQREREAAAARARAQEAARRAEAERRRQEELRKQQQRQSFQTQINQANANISDVDNQINSLRQNESQAANEWRRLENQVAQESQAVSKFSNERSNPSMMRVLLLGGTGHGKSLFANRLIGDESEECERGIFHVSDDIASATSAIQKEARAIRVEGVGTVNVCVIDTPGFGDSQHRDRQHASNLVEFLRGIEKIHAFVWVRQVNNPRLNSDDINELRQMTSMFGREFWARVVMVLTGVDRPTHERQAAKLTPQLQQKIRHELGLSEREAPLPYVWSGFDAARYRSCVQEFYQMLRPDVFFTCGSLSSPLDELKQQRDRQKNCMDQIQARLRQQYTRKDQLAQQVSSLYQQLSRV